MKAQYIIDAELKIREWALSRGFKYAHEMFRREVPFGTMSIYTTDGNSPDIMFCCDFKLGDGYRTRAAKSQPIWLVNHVTDVNGWFMEIFSSMFLEYINVLLNVSTDKSIQPTNDY